MQWILDYSCLVKWWLEVYCCFSFTLLGKKVKVNLEGELYSNLLKSFLAQKIDIFESSFINSYHNYGRLKFRGSLEKNELNIKNVSICFSINIDKFSTKLLPILDLVENSDSSNVGRKLQLSLG